MQTNLKSQSDENVIMLNKPRTISERLAEAAKSTFVGRKAERRLISDAIAADELPFMVAFIHGPGGIGKSRLLQAALSDSGPDVQCCMMDCREIEPTPRGFQATLGTKLSLPDPEPDLSAVVNILNQSARRTVLALDTYESFGLMDTWLRQKFLPSLSDRVFTIIAGRQAPNPAWLMTPGWQELFRDIKLGELSAVDTQEMLESRGLTQAQADRIISFARGYPMVLEIAAAAIRGQPDLKIAEGPPPKVLQQLTNVFLSGMPPESMEAVEAASTVRRVTEPLLRRLLAVADVRALFNKLQTLPFVNFANEGLIFHDIVRETVSRNLAQRDPERYRIYRKRAFSYFTHESHRTVARNLWQYTADLLYMIENPMARGAFFPEGGSDYRVEPATADDAEDIRQIIMAKEPGQSAHLFGRWLARHPETFSVARSSSGRLEAFYFTFEPEKVDRSLLEQDPLMVSWLQHLKETPLAPGERVLFLPRWLDRETGEASSPSVGACFLDIKRTYMELRPGLRRIYALVTDLAKIGPILFPLGFKVLEKAQTTVSGVTYYTIINDFGPSSIDGWLAKLIGTELEAKSGDLQETAQNRNTPSEDGRRLLTILFTDIVASTEKAVALGDARWRDLLDRHHDIVRRELARFEGREIDTAGDGFLATFTKPANAIRCATSVRDAIHKLGIQIRAGLHLGECEVTADAVRGVAVHIGARVAAKAKTGEVLVSGTVKDAMAGSGIQFRNRGAQRLKGIPGEWPLFAIELVPVEFQESSR